jgi:hypothetical protein
MKQRPNSALATIDTVVAYVLSDMNLEHEYATKGEKVAQMALRGFMDFNMYHLDNIRVKYINVIPDNSIDLPTDFIDYVKVAVNLNGKLWTLTVNDSIPLPEIDKCGQQIQDITNTFQWQGGGFYFPDHYNNGFFVGGAYSLTGGFNTAYYRIDIENRKIWFRGFVPNGQIVLEYISNGVNLSEQTLIPRIAVEPLVNFIHYKFALQDVRKNRGQIDDLRREYQNSVNQMRFFIGSMTEDDFKDLHYQSYKQTPKR